MKNPEVTNHIFNAVVNDFVRHRNRLFRVTGIVIFYDLQFVAFNAAFSVDNPQPPALW